MNWPQIREKLYADKGKWSLIARETGLHVNGIRKLANGDTPSPRIDTVEKIIAYYARRQRRRADRVRETA